MGHKVLLMGLSALTLSGCAGGAPTDGRMPAAGYGLVEAECSVTPDRRLSDCLIIEERPLGRGLGERALRSAAQAQFAPGTAFDTKGKVRFTLRFDLDEPSAP